METKLTEKEVKLLKRIIEHIYEDREVSDGLHFIGHTDLMTFEPDDDEVLDELNNKLK